MQAVEGEVRRLLTKVRANVDFPVPLEPVITITGGTVEEKEEGLADSFCENLLKMDPQDLGKESIGTL